MSISQSNSAGPGVTESARVDTDPNFFFIRSTVNAGAFGPSDASGRGALTVGTNNTVSTDVNKGEVGLSTFANASSLDQITVSGAPGDNRLVILHTSLDLFEFPGRPALTILQDDQSHLNFSATASTRLMVDGDGVSRAADGSDVFAFQDFSASRTHEGLATLLAPGFVDVDLAFTLGQVRDFSLSLTETSQIDINDFAGNLVGNVGLISGFELDWGGFASITDAATGEDLCGLTVSSAAGVNFSTRACPGDGGGTGGVEGGGVPEPQAWALMITGFGMAGAMLRRRQLQAA